MFRPRIRFHQSETVPILRCGPIIRKEIWFNKIFQIPFAPFYSIKGMDERVAKRLRCDT